MGLARSFLKGKRFAFRRTDNLMACERCVFGSGEHSCLASGEATREPTTRLQERPQLPFTSTGQKTTPARTASR
jgi:hypothetical protein